MTDWTLRKENGEYPAPDAETLRRWAREGRIAPSDYVFNPVLEKWMYASDVQELAGTIRPTSAARRKGSNPILIGCGVLVGLVLLGGVVESLRETAPHASAPAATTTWHNYTLKDEMTGQNIAFAETKSLNTQDLHWPYGPGIGATLTLRKHPRSGQEIYIHIDKGQILCTSYESCNVKARFDDRIVTDFPAIAASDGTTETVFVLDENGWFLDDLRESKAVLVELPLYQDGTRSWRFNVSGLTWR